jgi:hypothetical protein
VRLQVGAAILLLVLLPFSIITQTQTSSTPSRDPQAVAIVQQSLATMSQSTPSDSTASGTVTLVAGSLTDSGTITILTLGTSQTSEQMQTIDAGYQATIYSNGQANQVQGSTSTSLQQELVVTSQSPDFPLPFMTAALNNSDESFQYVGIETLNGVSVSHIRFWDTFASTTLPQSLAPLSTYDVWLDANSSLPLQLSYISQAYQGTAPQTLVQLNYSNYQQAGGSLYPMMIGKSLNGTPWASIVIQQVQLNTGLTDANFPVQ